VAEVPGLDASVEEDEHAVSRDVATMPTANQRIVIFPSH
jgi:hypothetical protein